MIKWNSSRKNELPLDTQEVIISVNGVNYISTFDATKRIFRTNELLETFFKVDDLEILWVDHKNLPPSGKNDRAKVYKGEVKKVNNSK